ncbi:hypothetical protein [Autumnicola musiva]|uniref:MORN repeat variant n=1 Tax=Autumnicola musiva TaxID=3075589 RepID=A0ABU3D7U1_9FLAO|nr:hypothetical protein [Zunongwangia sp. F117]MDT0677607.1 hypothetical protein [Zunongwangia sp. F117]
MKIICVLLMITVSSASYSQIVTDGEDPYPLLIQEDFYSNGKLKSQKLFNYEIYKKTKEFEVEQYIEYYDNGQLSLKIKMKNSVLHGPLVDYWKNGNLKRKDLYNNGNLVEGNVWNQNEKEIEYFKYEIPSRMKED